MANNILEDPKFGEECFGIPEEDDVSSEGGEEGGGGLDILTSVLDADIAVTAVKLGKVATAKNAKAAFLTQFLLYKGGPIENFFLGSIVSGSVISTALLGDEAMGRSTFVRSAISSSNSKGRMPMRRRSSINTWTRWKNRWVRIPSDTSTKRRSEAPLPTA